MNSRVELRIIRRFLYVASSMPNIHGISSRWASVALRDMILPTVYLMEHLVSYRHAVLDFLSSLIHENLLFDIFQIRCAHFALPQTRGHTKESLCRLIWSLNNAIVRKSKRGAAEIFKWALKLSVEMSLRNYRRIYMTLRTNKRSRVIKFFLNCTAGKWMIKLLSWCLHELLPVDTKKYLTMLYDMGMSHGGRCIWILCGMAGRFPLVFFNYLFKTDVEKFWSVVREYKRRFSSRSSSRRCIQFCRERMRSVMRNTRIYGAIVKSLNPEVTSKMTRYFSRGMWAEGNKPAREFPFLFRLCVCSPRVASFLVVQFLRGNRRIMPPQLCRAEKCLSYVPELIIYGLSKPLDVYCRTIMAIKNKYREAVLESLWQYTFTKNRNDDPSMKLFRKRCLDLTYQILLHNCRYNKRRRCKRKSGRSFRYKYVSRYTLLDKVISTPKTVLSGMVSRNCSQRTFFLQCAVGVSYVKGPVAMSEYLNYILFTSTHPYQLAGFFKLCKMVPRNVNEAIRLLMRTRQHVIETKFPIFSCRFPAEVMCSRWAINMRKVIKADKMLAKRRRPIMPRHVMINWQSHIIELCFVCVEFDKHGIGGLWKLGCGCSTVAGKTAQVELHNSAVMKSYGKLCEYFGMFIRSQYFYARMIAIAFLIRTAKPEVDKFALGEKELKAEITRTASKLNVRGQLLKYYYKKNPAMLDRKSYMPFSEASGAIACTAPLIWNAKQSLKLCRLFDRLCIERVRKKRGIKYSLVACKQLAKNLSSCWRGERFPNSSRFPTKYEYVCLDIEMFYSSSSYYYYHKNYFSTFFLFHFSYVAYKKELQKYPFLFDLLMLVSEAYPCLWYCFSILKGLFYMCIAEVEGCLSKKSRLENSLLMRLQLIMLLFMKGKMLPPPLCYVMGLQEDLELSCFFNVLVNVYDYLATIVPTVKQIDQLFEQELKNPGSTVPFRGNMKGALEYLEYVCIFNMEKLGPIYAKFIDTS
ncbi:hypothetical protein T05_15603 [Trichinella murrelli]|uniref:Integrator complex subunit 5 C-terminal domain-containing protein n=1 Tax=Trichinella murrelli TaxID=144512 RepID=A0A0V0TB72_9BILA|nr:hypothetical protein T05_15603 [Trichinella murrelli]